MSRIERRRDGAAGPDHVQRQPGHGVPRSAALAGEGAGKPKTGS